MSRFENNLSEGSVAKNLIRFSLPFLISNIVQSVYSVADMLIVGNFCGPESMSGVNIGGQVTFILTNIIIGLCAGGTVLIAQYLGAGNKDGMHRATATIFTLLIAAAAVITVLMLVLKDQVLQLIQTPAESFAESSSYLTVTVTGIIFIFGYNALSAVMRGMGDSKRPFWFVMIACVMNIGLDFLFVAGFGMRAFGAALATVISQAFSMFMCVIYMVRNKFIFDFKLKSFRMYREQLRIIFRLGLPSAIQNGVTSLSFLFITALVNVIGGVNASAAVGVVGKLNGFAIMPAVAMSASISTMSAQNIGAGKWDRAVKTCKIGAVTALSISLVIFALFQAFPDLLLSMFGDDPAVLEHGVAYIRSFSFDYLFVPVLFCMNGLFVGAGHTFFSLINGLMSSVLLRVPMSFLFGSVLGMGLPGVGLGAPIASAGSLIVVICFYISGKWRVNKVRGVHPGETPQMTV